MKLIVGNLKTYLETNEIKEYINKIKKVDNLIILPSAIHIPYFINKKIKLGLQNISLNNITGEITLKQAKTLGISTILVGHSERKIYCNETNVEINLKIKAALENKMNVILCIGETKQEKDNNLTKISLKKQLDECLKNIKEQVIIAYEPEWSVGTGIILANEKIKEIITFIKENYPYKVLYGGSINENNIKLLEQIPTLDGYLIGETSSKIEEFNRIIEYINK